MNQFRVYLMAELRKLGNEGDAKDFLSIVNKEELRLFNISPSKNELIKQFNSQDAVTNYICTQSTTNLELLAKLLDESWRKNGVYKILKRYSIWEEKEIPVSYIYIKQAECKLGYIFKRHNFKLLDIMKDQELWINKPYCSYYKERRVEFTTCLAIKFDDLKYEIFDGVHRAIQMALQNKEYLNLYYAKD